jgi:hypothetical protein
MVQWLQMIIGVLATVALFAALVVGSNDRWWPSRRAMPYWIGALALMALEGGISLFG